MNILNIAGIGMLALPFVAMIGLMLHFEGLKFTLIFWTCLVAFCAWVGLGSYLMSQP